MGYGKPTNDIDVSYVNYSHYQHGFNRSIKLSLEENDRKIKFLRESLSSSVESIKGVVKHCTMINNQIEQLATLQNTLFEKISYNANKACAITTRRSTETQDPYYPEGHPRRVEQDTLKRKKSPAGESPNENEDTNENQEQETSISDVETQDGNEDVQSQSNENQQESQIPEESQATPDEGTSSPPPKKGKKKEVPPSNHKGRDP